MPAKTHDANGFETFAQVGNKAMKDQFEKAAAAFGELNAFSKENVEALVEAMSKTGKSMEEINAAVMAYSKQAMEDGVAAARRLAGAKSVQEILEVQSEFAKASFDAYIGEVNKMSDLVSGAMKDAIKPINARMTAAVEMFQAQR